MSSLPSEKIHHQAASWSWASCIFSLPQIRRETPRLWVLKSLPLKKSFHSHSVQPSVNRLIKTIWQCLIKIFPFNRGFYLHQLICRIVCWEDQWPNSWLHFHFGIMYSRRLPFPVFPLLLYQSIWIPLLWMGLQYSQLSAKGCRNP